MLGLLLALIDFVWTSAWLHSQKYRVWLFSKSRFRFHELWYLRYMSTSIFQIFMRRLWCLCFLISIGKCTFSWATMRLGSTESETLLGPYFSINTKAKKGKILKWSFFSRAKVGKVQVVSDSCWLVSPSNCFNSSNKDCDWLILACFIRVLFLPTLLLCFTVP